MAGIMRNNNNNKEALTDSLTPVKTVKELDKYIIGQGNAKKAVAIALRNRARRQALDEEIKDEIAPKNIIMIGPTGVGKTEIARRLSKLSGAPFIKVEATKYTEVGYVGRDVESMIRDLVNISVNMVKKEMRTKVEEKAEKQAETELLNLLLPKKSKFKKEEGESIKETREKFRKMLKDGKFEHKTVPIKITKQQSGPIEIFTAGQSMEEIDQSFQSILNNIMPPEEKEKKTTVKEARKILIEREIQKLIDMDKVVSEAIKRAEQMGIVFLDEIDKIVSKDGQKSGADVSREGVQRDILPIIEGSTINTKYGAVKTEHILFIAAGAFHISKPSDLIPELQGRFPIRVELDSLSKSNLAEILTQPKNALVKQYKALLSTEGVKIEFTDEAIEEISEIAYEVNSKTENIGARRLHTIMEKLLEDISFEADQMTGQEVSITKEYVHEHLNNIVEDRDVSRYIL